MPRPRDEKARRPRGRGLASLLLAATLLGVGMAATAGRAGLHSPSAAASSEQPHQQFIWDFTDCYDRSIRSQDAEFVNADRWGLSGGCHLRLLTPGASWVETTFSLAADPRAGEAQAGAWTLSMLHLAVLPDGPRPGLAPVRVTLNGQDVWQGRITEGGVGPDGLWAATVTDVTSALARGPNTLRWEFVGDGATHYWLKLARVGWDPP